MAARGDLARAVFGYNHSRAYVEDVLAHARAYSARSDAALTAPSGSQLLSGHRAARQPSQSPGCRATESSRTHVMLPAWAMAGGRPAQPIDAPLLDNAVWLLRT